MKKDSYIVATIRPWNIEVYKESLRHLPGKWHLITHPKQLTFARLKRLDPRYIFFPHWSQKIKPEIIRDFECVCFHMTDVPYGRGGSPLQNLIVRGKETTKITALRMTERFDAGPVYIKRSLSLHGRAEDIYRRAAAVVGRMITEMVRKELKPKPQRGKVVVFKRRTPEQSEITPDINSLKKLYDHIRMLDAEGYPKAYLSAGRWRFEFSHVTRHKDHLTAQVNIIRPQKGKK